MKFHPPLRALMPLLIAGSFCLSHVDAAPRLHWKLDETTGTSAADSSGSGFAGTWKGTVGTPAWVGGGVDGGAFQFTGANADSFIVESFTADGGGAFVLPCTMSVWVKTTATNSSGVAYLGNGTASSYYNTRMVAGKGRITARNTTEVSTSGGPVANDDNWHLITTVYNTTTDRVLYVDGVQAGISTTDVPVLPMTRFGIGALTRNTPYNPADLYIGLLDDAAVWARGFTARQAAALYAIGKLRTGNASDLDPLLAAFDSLGEVMLKGRKWVFASSLGFTVGETGGSVAGLDAYIVLDASGDGMKMATAPGNPVVAKFTPLPANIFLGASSTLSWEVGDSTSISISPGIGAVTNGIGSVNVTPSTTTTYTLTALNGGGSATAQATVTVIPDPVIKSFTALPVSLFAGETATLSWNVDNFTSLSINQGIGPVTGAIGSVIVTPATTTTYTLTATNPQNTLTAQTTVTVLAKAQPVIHWRLDETSGLLAQDSSGALNGDLVGNPVWAPGGGAIGGALAFDGIDSVVRQNSAPIAGYPFVLSAWFKSTSPNRQVAVYLGDSSVGNAYYVIGTSGTNSEIGARDATSNTSANGPLISDGVWHQLVGVFESDIKKTLYVDGVAYGTITASKAFIPTLNRFSAGHLDRPIPADRTTGSIDDVGLWTGSFSARDIAVFYSLGRLGGTVVDFPGFRTAFATQSSVTASGVRWTYASGLAGLPGNSGGTIGGGDAYVIFDDLGNGLKVSSLPERPIFTNVRKNPDGSVSLAWSSIPAVSYRTEYSTNLSTWNTIHAAFPSGGASTGFTYTVDMGPNPATEPRLYFRATRLP